jgi:hypothetical protein
MLRQTRGPPAVPLRGAENEPICSDAALRAPPPFPDHTPGTARSKVSVFFTQPRIVSGAELDQGLVDTARHTR